MIIYQGSSFATGYEVSEKRKRVLILSTGSKSVDAILGGSYGNVNEGEYATKPFTFRRSHVPINH